MNGKIYLAGPMSGITGAQMNAWRSEVKAAFAPCTCADPCRGHNLQEDTPLIDGVVRDPIIGTPKAIVTRDFNDVANSKLIVMNLLGATKVSVGTMVELGWASAYRIPVLLIIEADNSNPHEHVFLKELCMYRVDNVQDAIKTIKTHFVELL